ncbi:PepSY domain-containing protein [Legionella pneumophila serogroup 1]
MKKRIIPSVCSGFILSFMTQIAIADDIPTRSLPMSQILQHLQSKGYHTIQEVEFDDGLYEVEALDEQGNQIILRMNPQTGDLAPKNRTPH